MVDPIKRFSGRVDAYSRYRPSYPRELTGLLQRGCGLSADSRIADIGCGTGLLTQLFLDFGCEVIGVEPNAEMRQAADRLLAGEARFRSVDGRAECTGLGDANVDFVAAAQAFHWFDPERSRVEFQRILKPGGWVVLTWNERAPAGDGFQAGYDDLVRRYAPEVGRIQEDAIDRVFGGRTWTLHQFSNYQRLDRAGLQGRLDSSSYAPMTGTQEHAVMVAAIEALFDKYQEEGFVTLLYDTLVYVGQAATSPGQAG